MSSEALPPEFETLYRETLLPQLERLERRRQTLLIGFVALFFALGSVLLPIVRPWEPGELSAIVAVSAALVAGIITEKGIVEASVEGIGAVARKD